MMLVLVLPPLGYPLGQIVSEHVRVRIPQEREWLGRECIVELERCWRYLRGATDNSLPRWVLVEVLWEGRDNTISISESTVSIGMAHPAAAANMKSYLLHNAAREMARLALGELSRGATQREELQFLAEGMAEILAHEYDGSTRALTSAWIVANFLDRVQKLGFAAQAQWASFSKGHRNLRSSAPGITFLMTCRERYGREKTLKLFEELKKGTLENSILSAFKTSAAALEEIWLKKVREHPLDTDIIVASDDEAPTLREVQFVHRTERRGKSAQIRLFLQDRGNDLSPGSVFVVDEVSRLVLQGKAPEEGGADYVAVDLPGDPKPGKHNIRICAADDSGNVRYFQRTYAVEP